MIKDELIALGLGNFRLVGRTDHTSDDGGSDPEDLFREPLHKLLTLLLDLVTFVDLRDEQLLQQHISACRDAIDGAEDRRTITSLVDECTAYCGRVLSELERQRTEQNEEIAQLVGMVREALAIMSGGGKDFTAHFNGSMQRFEAIVKLDDLKQLKLRLAQEIGTLKQIASDRQREWEKTAQQFAKQVDTLERQLTMTKREAALDPLTHVLNRGTFDRMFQEWKNTRHSDFVLGMVDIDHFKLVNDTHGHAVGDQALITVARGLQRTVRSEADVVGRVGGDEFAVLIAGTPLRQAEARLRQAGSGLDPVPTNVPGKTVRITISSGVAECSAGDTLDSLRERADAALYEAKRLGRNRVVSKEKPTMRDLRAR